MKVSKQATQTVKQVKTAAGDGNALQACGVNERAVLAAEWSKWLRGVLPLQRLDGSDQDGGFADNELGGWCDGREAAYRLARLIAAYCWGEAIDVYRQPLREAIRRAAKFIVRRQAPDGRLDLGGYYSPNEAGFPVPGLVAAYKHLPKADAELFADIKDDLQQFIQRAAEAVLAGSAYTANHRWTAACAPLAAAHSLWPDKRYLAKIEDYLADGFDCDDDGFWYEERSPNYNMVANSGLVVMADCLKRPEFLKPVLRNFQFVLNMIQPNGEIDSSFSHRQDRAQADRSPCNYSMARRAAQVSGDGRITTLAMQALTHREMIYGLVPVLFDVDEHPQALPAPVPLPTEYERVFKRQSIARIRRDDTALTLAADRGGHFCSDVRDQWGGRKYSDDWFHLHHQNLVVESLQLAPAGMLAIQPRTLARKKDGIYKLAGESRGWTHTLHFRPGSPPLEMRWDVKHSEDMQWQERTITLHLQCSATDYALIASLNLWVRPDIHVLEEGGSGKLIKAGKTIHLSGGGPLTLVGKQGTKLRLTGLPKSQHTMRIVPAEPIPSRKGSECGLLCLGLRMPVDLTLQFSY